MLKSRLMNASALWNSIFIGSLIAHTAPVILQQGGSVRRYAFDRIKASQLSALDHHDFVAEGHGFLHPVSGNQKSLVRVLLDVRENELHHFVARNGVESAGRLIQNED